MDSVSKYSGDLDIFANSALNDSALLNVVKKIDVERINQSANLIFERVSEERLASLKPDELAMVVYEPETVEPQKDEGIESFSKTAKSVIIVTSASAATAVYNLGVGLSIVEGTVGIYSYMTAVPTTAGIFAQYFGILGAGGVGTAVGGVVQGAGLAIVVNALPALIAGGGVMFGAAYIFNTLMAKKPEEEISVELIDLAKPTYDQVTAKK